MPPQDYEQARWVADEVRQHESALRGYLHHNFPTLDVDDVVQESYLKLLRARPAGRIASTKAYLFSIARNTALTIFHRRRIYSETPLSELPERQVLEDRKDAADALVLREKFEYMSHAIVQLPARCRDVMCLAVLQGCTNAEIATRLGLSESTVRVHLACGIRKCADFLRNHGLRQ